MARFLCEQHPQLVVMTGEGVLARFVDGACEASDPAAVTVLRGTDGVVEVAAPSVVAVEDTPRPRQRGKRTA